MKSILLVVQVAFGLGLFLCAILPAYPHDGGLDSHKILKGAKPADLPVQQATKFEFVINLNAAKQIGLTIPVRVLERADRVLK
jgi:hypothetical protein